MAVKRYNEQTIEFVNAKGEIMGLYCYCTYTRNGFCHTVTYDGMTVKVSYLNRTWERFTYESALYKFFNKYFKGAELDGLKAQIETIANNEKIKADEWFDRMVSIHSSLSDKGKEIVANTVDKYNITSAEGIESALLLGAVLQL